MNLHGYNNKDTDAEVSIYQAPTITTYTSSELLDLIGPVQAGSMDLDDDTIPGLGYYAPEDDQGVGLI